MKRFWVIILGDFLSFWVAFSLIIFIRFDNVFFSSALQTHLLPFAILYISWVLCFYLFGLYDLFAIKPTLPYLKQFGVALITLLSVGILFFYFVPLFGITPKTNLLFQVFGFGMFSFLWRRMIYLIFSKQLTRPAIICGENVYLDKIIEVINTNPQLGLQLILKTNNIQEAFRKLKEIKNVVLIFDENNNHISKQDIVNLYKNDAEVLGVVEAYERYIFKIPVDHISESWVVENIKIKKYALYNFINEIINILIPLSLLILTSPFLLITALLIKVSDGGPIFIRQKRVGENGKIFRLFKFRSMVALDKDGQAENGTPTWSEKNDPRVTGIGKIIRATHIDEIPQMINILKGDMNLIGPRPERPEFVEKLEQSIPYYDLRHIIRPGFTGWAQIKYRYARTIEDSKEKFEYDFYYTKNRNIFLDFGIILKTIQIIFTH